MRHCKTCSKREDRHNVRHPFIPFEPVPRFRSDACGSSIDCAWGCPGCPQTIREAVEGIPPCDREVEPMGSE